MLEKPRPGPAWSLHPGCPLVSKPCTLDLEPHRPQTDKSPACSRRAAASGPGGKGRGISHWQGMEGGSSQDSPKPGHCRQENQGPPRGRRSCPKEGLESRCFCTLGCRGRALPKAAPVGQSSPGREGSQSQSHRRPELSILPPCSRRVRATLLGHRLARGHERWAGATESHGSGSKRGMDRAGLGCCLQARASHGELRGSPRAGRGAALQLGEAAKQPQALLPAQPHPAGNLPPAPRTNLAKEHESSTRGRPCPWLLAARPQAQRRVH